MTCKKSQIKNEKRQLNATRALLATNQKKCKHKLAFKVVRLPTTNKSRGPDKKKSFSEYSRKEQSCIRNQLKEQCQRTLSLFRQHDFIPSKEIFLTATVVLWKVDLLDNDTTELLNSAETQVPKNEIDDMNMWLYVKDKFNKLNEK